VQVPFGAVLAVVEVAQVMAPAQQVICLVVTEDHEFIQEVAAVPEAPIRTIHLLEMVLLVQIVLKVVAEAEVKLTLAPEVSLQVLAVPVL